MKIIRNNFRFLYYYYYSWFPHMKCIQCAIGAIAGACIRTYAVIFMGLGPCVPVCRHRVAYIAFLYFFFIILYDDAFCVTKIYCSVYLMHFAHVFFSRFPLLSLFCYLRHTCNFLDNCTISCKKLNVYRMRCVHCSSSIAFNAHVACNVCGGHILRSIV